MQQECLLVSYVRVMLENGMTPGCLGIGVQFEHDPQVLQRILLQDSADDLLPARRRQTVDVTRQSIYSS